MDVPKNAIETKKPARCHGPHSHLAGNSAVVGLPKRIYRRAAGRNRGDFFQFFLERCLAILLVRWIIVGRGGIVQLVQLLGLEHVQLFEFFQLFWFVFRFCRILRR